MGNHLDGHAAVLEKLRVFLLAATQAHLAVERCVLLDHPSHWNVGDHAIWLGERELLSHAGLRVSYAASIRSVDWSVLDATRREDPILVHGGGNLGDLWPRHQAFREEVIRRFPDRRIIQMPQTLWFESRDALDRARRCFETHPDFTLFTRDERSYRYAQQHFDIPTFLCPDTALWLRPHLIEPPTHDVLALMRTDREADLGNPLVPGQVAHADWLGRGPLPAFTMAGLSQRVAARVRQRQAFPGVTRLLSASFDRLSRYHLRRGIGILSAGQVVITDRLHGHILCLLLGIPHVALDNSYGKVHEFIDTWTGESPLVHKAPALEDAMEMAQALLKNPHP